MSQRRTVPTTKSGTLENDSPKKEHWKSKAKRERLEQEAKTQAIPKGNPNFTLTPELEAEAAEFQFESLIDEEAMQHSSTPKTLIADKLDITAEDLEIDKMLERQAKAAPMIDHGPDQDLKRESIKRDTLRNHAENYKPASSLMELEDQVFLAKQNDIDSIEATPQVVKHFCRKEYEYIKTNVGYFIYKDIRVYIDGFFDQNKDADKLTMEQKLHGKGSKHDTVPIITPQKI